MKKKPVWFSVWDAVTIGTPGLVMAGLTIYMMVSGFDGPRQAIPLMWTVTVAFMAIWLRWTLLKKADIDSFVWYPTYGLMLKPEQYVLPPAPKVNELVKQVIDSWTPIYPNAAQIITDGEVIWGFFKKDLDENDKNPAHQKVKGVTLAYSYTIEVDYNQPNESIYATALTHELGHLIIGHATGNWDQTFHHSIMNQHNLL